jgi:putative ABC transport system substrate-binding protein
LAVPPFWLKQTHSSRDRLSVSCTKGLLPPPSLKAAFRKGLVEVGISDGLDIRIEDRAADGKYDQLPALAADLVNRQAAVMAAELLPAALAAKAATQSIPIVFLSGSDPIGSGLVSSINRPTSNVTGMAFMFTRLRRYNPAGDNGGRAR